MIPHLATFCPFSRFTQLLTVGLLQGEKVSRSFYVESRRPKARVADKNAHHLVECFDDFHSIRWTLSAKYTFALLVFDNPDLTEIAFKEKLRYDKSSVLIRANPKLTNVKGVKIDYGGPTDCTISTSKSVRNCKVVVGDVGMEHLSSKAFENVEEVIGTIRVEHSNVPYLNALDSLKLVGWKKPALKILYNKRLVDISSLLTMDIQSKAPAIEIRGNPNICHNIVERNKIKEWLTKKGSSVKFSDRCLKSCPGGTVTGGYLAGIEKHCNTIAGNLIVDGLKKIPDSIVKLEQVEKIDGRVFVTNNEALRKLHFLKNVVKISGAHAQSGSKGKSKLSIHSMKARDRRRLIIQGNPNLAEIQFNEQLHLGTYEAFIKLNPKLKAVYVKGASFRFDLGDARDCLASSAKNSYCRTVIGDVRYDELDSKVWKRIEKVDGRVLITNTKLRDLDSLRDLKITSYISPALTIEDNEKLVDISALLTMDIASYPPVISISNNPRICHNIAERKQLEARLRKWNARVKFVEDCLLSCPGGKVSRSYLESFDKRCNVVKGNLVISGLYKLPTNIDKLEQVEKIDGRLIVTNNRAVKDLSFLKNLREINNPELDKPGLVVKNNRNFKNKGLDSLIKVTGGEGKITAAQTTRRLVSTARKAKRKSTSLSTKETTATVTTRKVLPVIRSRQPPEKSKDSNKKGNPEPDSTDASMPILRNVKLKKNKEKMQKLAEQKGPAANEGLFWLAIHTKRSGYRSLEK
ncbi:unnamed protein product [Cylicocyclus nassatus]|uniref:Receptor L-domain domain-containing protein n=1 Tax=Cylicocyclus nassatus TaxID=53992 RepID=A0AA36M5M8_CYLNA|nr:unnamed protein product [Cylicocyclus nassatus]